MRLKLLILFFAATILSGFFYYSASKVSEIDSLVIWLTKNNYSESLWMNGFYVPVSLSREATPDQVFSAYRLASHDDTPYRIIATKKVILAHREMIAIHFVSDGSRHILFTRFQDEKFGWWTKLF